MIALCVHHRERKEQPHRLPRFDQALCSHSKPPPSSQKQLSSGQSSIRVRVQSEGEEGRGAQVYSHFVQLATSQALISRLVACQANQQTQDTSSAI